MYFGMESEDQGRSWSPCKIYCVRVYNLIFVSKGKNKHSDVVSYWYRGGINITLMTVFFTHLMLVSKSLKARKSLLIQIVLVLTLFPHIPKISYLNLRDILEDSSYFDSNNGTDDDFQYNIDNEDPQLCNQSEHSNLIRDLGLSERSAEILGFKLKQKT